MASSTWRGPSAVAFLVVLVVLLSPLALTAVAGSGPPTAEQLSSSATDSVPDAIPSQTTPIGSADGQESTDSSPSYVVTVDAADTVMEGSAVMIQAAVHNTGDEAGTPELTIAVDGTAVLNETVTVPAGSITTEAVEYAVGAGDLPAIDVTASVAAASATTTIVVEPSTASFDVAVDVPAAVTAGDDVEVNVSVTNTGTGEATQDIVVSAGGETIGTFVDLTLAAGTSTSVTAGYQTDETDVPVLSVAAHSEDDIDQDSLTVHEGGADPPGPISIAAPVSVDPGESVAIDVTVENPGDETVTEQLTVTVDDADLAVETVTIAPGESSTETVTYETVASDVPDISVTASTDADTATTSVAVGAPDAPHFAVSLDVPASVTAGDRLAIEATVENTGLAAGVQPLTITAGEDTVTQIGSVALAPGESITETASLDTTAADRPTVSVGASSGDEDVATTVLVDDPPTPEFQVTVAADDPVTAGESVAVEATVENTGDAHGSQDVTFWADGTLTDGRTLWLSPDETTTVDFAYETGESDVPAVTLAVESDDDTGSVTTTVEQPDGDGENGDETGDENGDETGDGNGDTDDGDADEGVDDGETDSERPDGDGDDADDDGPGFGLAVALTGIGIALAYGAMGRR